MKTIAFQGELGAYSHEACLSARPNCKALPCKSFEEVISAVNNNVADLAMLPVENTTYGRVADIHRLLPGSGLHIIDEVFTRVKINLLSLPGERLEDIESVEAHLVLLPQASAFLEENNIRGIQAVDSAGAAAALKASKTKGAGVLASKLAAEIYDLKVLAENIEDSDHNTTRFLLMSSHPDNTRRGDTKMMTTFIFQVRNIPAALYKAMGGFATNGVNMTKLESYMVGGSFSATQFYADIEGHPDDNNVKLAMDELSYFTQSISILGVYPASSKRV